MADISKLNVNSTDYNIKDASAISDLSASGRIITYTKRDGTTGTINTQDTNTTYSAGTGLTLSGTTFSISSANASTIVNQLSTGSSDPTDKDYYVAQYAAGGSAITTYHRRPHSALWNYIKGKISSVLGLTATSYSGKALTAGTADNASKVNNLTVQTAVPANAKFTDTTYSNATQSANGLMSADDKKKLDEIIGIIYPVGSIYMSTNNVSPQTFIGGTWERIKDRFLLSAGDTYTAGNTGGSATHTITTSEMPSHTHSVSITTDSKGSHTHKLKDWGNTTSGTTAVNVGGNSVGSASTYSTESAGAHKHTVSGNTGTTGSGTAMNIMNPYLVVYVWKRTA